MSPWSSYVQLLKLLSVGTLKLLFCGLICNAAFVRCCCKGNCKLQRGYIIIIFDDLLLGIPKVIKDF